MRRLSRKRKERELRLSRYVTRAHQRARRAQRPTSRLPKVRGRPKFATILAPKKLVFHGDKETRDIFHSFTCGISSRLKAGYLVQLDFRNVELLHPCGVLLLLSHVRSWTTAHPGRLSSNYPSDEVVEQMLQSVGILEKLGLVARMTVSRVEVTRWYYFRGETMDATQMAPFMEVAKVRLGEANQSALYDSVVEAITNVTHHAYGEEEAKKWWMFASMDAENMYVSIFDGGRSIPGTLLEKPAVRDQVRSWFWGRKKADARMLHAAMGGKSRTRLRYRGKGLPEMLQSTKSMVGSSLAIYSRHGVFYCDSGRDHETHGQLPTPIDGTLLLWSLRTSED